MQYDHHLGNTAKDVAHYHERNDQVSTDLHRLNSRR